MYGGQAAGYIKEWGKRAVVFAASIFLLSVVVFYGARLAPGDPLASYYGERVERMTLKERDQAEERLGLRDPIHVQYVRWLSGALRGELGISFKYKRPVTEVIGERAVNTLLLGGIGFILTFVLALLLGILCAWHEGSLADKAICKVGTIASCIPGFWLALVAILLFSVKWGLLPSSGAYSVGKADDLGDRVFHLILPLALVVTGHLWYYAYMVRNKLLEEIHADYVHLARMKGLGKRQIIFRHCLPNILPSYLSLMAIAVPHILGGTYILEMVFSYPGLGTLSYESARYKDYDLLMVLCLLSGTIVILCNAIAQAVNERIDPRIGREVEEISG